MRIAYVYANSAHGICATSMQIALTHKSQAALWVTNGCTSMSKPVTTQSTPMGVDNNLCSEYFYANCITVSLIT